MEDLLAERGIIVSYQTIRQSCERFGVDYTRKLKRRERRLGDHWYLDEVFILIKGQQRYLWRAVDQDGDVIDILVQPHRDQYAAERFFRKLMRGQDSEPLRIVSDQLRSYSAPREASSASRLTAQNGTPTIASKPHINHQPARRRQMRDSNLPGTRNVSVPP